MRASVQKPPTTRWWRCPSTGAEALVQSGATRGSRTQTLRITGTGYATVASTSTNSLSWPPSARPTNPRRRSFDPVRSKTVINRTPGVDTGLLKHLLLPYRDQGRVSGGSSENGQASRPARVSSERSDSAEVKWTVAMPIRRAPSILDSESSTNSVSAGAAFSTASATA